jgi:hypothetical protein
MQASTTQIIDFTAARAERARQKRRAELAAARHSSALLLVRPVFAPYGMPFPYYGYSLVPVFGVATPARMAAGNRYW